MDASVFWSVIGAYNRQTVMLQVFLLALLSAALSVAYRHRRGRPAWLALGVAHLFIGIVFFGIYGTEPIQKYFAMPLFVLCGFLFLYEGIWHKSGVLDRPTRAQWVLLALYVLYPLISALLGNRFPTLVTHIMPCPVAYLGLVVYAGCRRKNVVLLGEEEFQIMGPGKVLFNTALSPCFVEEAIKKWLDQENTWYFCDTLMGLGDEVLLKKHNVACLKRSSGMTRQAVERLNQKVLDNLGNYCMEQKAL